MFFFFFLLTPKMHNCYLFVCCLLGSGNQTRLKLLEFGYHARPKVLGSDNNTRPKSLGSDNHIWCQIRARADSHV